YRPRRRNLHRHIIADPLRAGAGAHHRLRWTDHGRTGGRLPEQQRSGPADQRHRDPEARLGDDPGSELEDPDGVRRHLHERWLPLVAAERDRPGAELMRTANEGTRAWVEEIMGIPMSIHLIGPEETTDAGADRAVQACFDELREIDRVFSTYRADSDISRIRRSEPAIADADSRMSLVADACERAEQDTGGLFSARWRGWFDPTGYVKGWAVEAASRRHLEPLLSAATAVGINAGGDPQLFT